MNNLLTLALAVLVAPAGAQTLELGAIAQLVNEGAPAADTKVKAEFDIGRIFKEAGFPIPNTKDAYESLKALFYSPSAKKTVPTTQDLTGWFMGHAMYAANHKSLANVIMIGSEVSYLDKNGVEQSPFFIWHSPYTGDSRSGIEGLKKQTFENLSCAPVIFPIVMAHSITPEEAGFSAMIQVDENTTVTQQFKVFKIGPYLLVGENTAYQTTSGSQVMPDASFSVFFKTITPSAKINCARRGTDI